MTNKIYSTIQELVERMGEPEHLDGMECSLEETAMINFTENTIKKVNSDKHGLKILVNYKSLDHYIEEEQTIISGKIPATYEEALPITVNTLLWTSLENTLWKLDSWTEPHSSLGYGRRSHYTDDQLGFDYVFYFAYKDRNKHLGEVDLRITQNGDYSGHVLREDFIRAFAEHLKKAIK